MKAAVIEAAGSPPAWETFPDPVPEPPIARFDPPLPEEDDAIASTPTDMVRERPGAADPNQAGIRVDLSGIGGRTP